MSAGEPDFSARLIAWQRTHGRHDLPWQQETTGRDAYRIWLSEIMLQQTQVSTVIPYFLRFVERYPDVETLAAAPVEKVLEAWAGLGYYARARNLQRCAQLIVSQHGARFPTNAQALDELPGIGRSTAAAIAVFAFGARAAILDGNVKRVLARCFGIDGVPSARTESTLWALAESLLPTDGIEAYTQGIMDLGATLCTRSKPRCSACPMQDICMARATGRQTSLPARKPARLLPERESTVLLLSAGRHVLLERRPPSGIWGGLLALPELPESGAEAFAGRHGCRLLNIRTLPAIRHSFTHFRLTIHTLHCTLDCATNQPPARAMETGWEWVDVATAETAALPTPVRKILTTFRAAEETAGNRRSQQAC